jgi:hypothetical protein
MSSWLMVAQVAVVHTVMEQAVLEYLDRELQAELCSGNTAGDNTGRLAVVVLVQAGAEV